MEKGEDQSDHFAAKGSTQGGEYGRTENERSRGEAGRCGENPPKSECPNSGQSLQFEVGIGGIDCRGRSGKRTYSEAHQGRRRGNHRIPSEQGDLVTPAPRPPPRAGGLGWR